MAKRVQCLVFCKAYRKLELVSTNHWGGLETQDLPLAQSQYFHRCTTTGAERVNLIWPAL